MNSLPPSSLHFAQGNAKPLLLTGSTSLESFLAAHPSGEVNRAEAVGPETRATFAGESGVVDEDVDEEEDVVPAISL